MSDPQPFSWVCPFCHQGATISYFHNMETAYQEINIATAHGPHAVSLRVIVCPNPDCLEFTFETSLLARVEGKLIVVKKWSLIPASNARVFPDYIPQAIREDYVEACAIREPSPKASSTLARRCLQGMIRDFFGVTNTNLAGAIDEIKENMDPTTWAAIDAVRKIGNIGAHMEKDVNLIVEVDSREAGALIKLIELLMNDWYINRYEREQQLKSVIAVAARKEELRKGSTKNEAATEPDVDLRTQGE